MENVKNEILLMEPSSTEGTNPGLLYGDAGMAIAAHLLARHNQDNDVLSRAALLLESISENISQVGALDFGTGLAGIGWAIEWLVQNGLLKDVNTDEVLADIDNVLYNEVTCKKEHIPSLLQGAMGKAAYFIKRGRSKNAGTHRYVQLSHQECLVMLTDDIDDRFRMPGGALWLNPGWDRFQPQHAVDLAGYMFLFGQLLRINEPVLEDGLFDIMRQIEILLDNLFTENDYAAILTGNPDLHYCLFYMAVAYLHSSRIHRHLHWLEKAKYYTGVLHTISIMMEEETELNLYRGLTVYALLHFYDPSLQYKMRLEEIMSQLKSMAPPPTLYNGWGSIVIAELSLFRPDLIDCWYELFYIATE